MRLVPTPRDTEPQNLTVEQYASTLPNKYLHCRELGHNWRHFTVSWDSKAKCYDRRLRCSSCHTIRVQILDRRGGVIRNRYEYASNYLAKSVGESMAGSRDAFRVEAIVRVLEAQNSSSEVG